MSKKEPSENKRQVSVESSVGAGSFMGQAEMDMDSLEAPNAKGGVTSSSNAPSAENSQNNEDGRVPVPSFITQTDASGKQVTKAQKDDVPPPIPNDDDPPPPSSLCACVVRYLCCIDYDELYAKDVPSILLPEQSPEMKGRPCLVLDLDETLVHSSFVNMPGVDFKLDIELEGKIFSVFVLLRPGLDDFLREMAEHYELVLFTASVGKYAQRVTERIDPQAHITYQLYREHCTYHEGNFVKDLSRLNRPMEKTIIVDNSHLCYQFQPHNAIGVSTFMSDKSDRELVYLKEFLLSLKDSQDFRKDLPSYKSFIEARYRQDFGNSLSTNSMVRSTKSRPMSGNSST